MSDSCNSRHFSWLMKSCFPNTQHPTPHHPTPIVPTATTISSLPDDLLLECLSRVTHSVLPSLPLVCSRWCHILDSPAFHILRHRHRLIKLTLFAVSVSEGTLLLASYGLENDGSWKICSFSDVLEHGCFLQARLTAIDRKIYVIGRAAMLRCDTWTGTVVGLQGPVYPRKKFAAAVVGGKIYVAGGCATASAVEEYDPTSNSWRVVVNAPRKRYGCVGASIDGVFYIIGGLKLGGASGNETARGNRASHSSSIDLHDTVNNETRLRIRSVPGGASGNSMARGTRASDSSHVYAGSMYLHDTFNGAPSGASSTLMARETHESDSAHHVHSNSMVLSDTVNVLPGGASGNEMARGSRASDSSHVYASSTDLHDTVNNGVRSRTTQSIPGGASSMLVARESRIYASSMDLYDTVNRVWLKPRSVPGGGCVIAACAAAGEIYILSSHAVELSFWKFNGLRKSNGFGEWRRIKPPPLPAQVRLDSRVRFSCVGVGEKVVLVQVNGCIDDLLRRSGRVERGMKEGLVLVYDCGDGEWSRGADLPEGVHRSACVCVEC